MDPLTGLATLQGTLWYNLEGTPTNFADIGGLMIDIAHDHANNILYGVDLGNDCLWNINPSTYELTLIGFMGIDINYAQDAAFDQENGLLYLAAYTTTGSLYWIDTVSGGAYKVGQLGSAGYECTGFAIPYGGAELDVPDVTISGTGTLTWTAVDGAASYNVYSSADPYGTFTWEGNTTSTEYTGAAAEKIFYIVTAVNAARLSSERPEISHNIVNRNTGNLRAPKRFDSGIAPTLNLKNK
jgi:hypothetical protein